MCFVGFGWVDLVLGFYFILFLVVDYLLTSLLLRVQTFHATALDACFLAFDVHWLTLSLAYPSSARLSVRSYHILDTLDLKSFDIINFMLLSKK